MTNRDYIEDLIFDSNDFTLAEYALILRVIYNKNSKYAKWLNDYHDNTNIGVAEFFNYYL